MIATTSTHNAPAPPLLGYPSHSRFRFLSHQRELRGRARPPRLLPLRCCCGSPPPAAAAGAGVADEAGRMAAAVGEMVCVSILKEGVFRFDVSEAARAAARPSLSFAEPRRREVPREGGDGPAVVPVCEVVGDVQKVLIKLPSGTSFYGTGEASGPLERTGKRVFTWNTDAWGFGPGTTSLYQSHPWVLAVLPDGKALGVLADTTRRCEIDLREESTIKFSASSTYPVITFGPFNTPAEVMTSLSHAIGTVSMPPKWSLGYHQCRWSYDSSEKVLEVVRTFREKGIPCDVVWMDIDYMDGFRCFTFDSNHFPDPKSMVDDLHSIGCKAIWMLDPGIKKEKGYFVYESGSENDVWIKKADGSPFIGEVWPGDCVFPDFTCERTRTWWASLVRDFISNGVDGIWNDMNEPAVFKTTTKTMPESNIHRGDAHIGGVQNHSYYHNVYGMAPNPSLLRYGTPARARRRKASSDLPAAFSLLPVVVWWRDPAGAWMKERKPAASSSALTRILAACASQAKDYGRCIAAKVPEIEHNMCSKEFLALRACMQTAVKSKA